MTTAISLATSAMICEINISCWAAKKLARKESDELTQAKSASKRAASVHKNLLADDAHLLKVNKAAADLRNWVAKTTLPWADSGARIISTAQFMGFKAELDRRKQEFNTLVYDFVQMYPTLISAQAFKLGSMFDRSEYPSDVEVASKFGIRYTFLPVPEAGDFRVDVASDIETYLREEYSKEYDRRVASVSEDLWGRLKQVLDKMQDRLSTNDDGDNKVFRGSLVENALDVCELLKVANVMGDARLEDARKATALALQGVTAEDLRRSEVVRYDVKSQVSDILDKFAF